MSDNKAFRDKQGFPFALLCDTDHEVAESYGALKGPDEPFPDFPKRVTILIRPDGMVAKTYDVRDPKAHPGEVLDDIRSMT